MRTVFILLFIALLSVNADALSIFAANSLGHVDKVDESHLPADPRVALDMLSIPVGESKLTWDPNHEWYPSGAEVKVNDKPDSRVEAVPKFSSEKPMFVVFRVDSSGPEGFIAAAIDESGGTDKGYDRAYIDCNRNWDLSDDTPCYVRHDQSINTNWYVSYSLSDLGQIRSSDWVNVKPTKSADKERDISISLIPCDLDKTETRGCAVLRRGDWTTKLNTNLGEVELRVMDSNCDGIYGNTSPGAGRPGDKIQINWMLIPNRQPTHAEIELFPAVRIGKRLLTISANDGKFTVQPYNGAVGRLRIIASGMSGRGCSVDTIRLTSPQTGQMELLDIRNQVIELPEGSYRFEKCSLSVSLSGGAKIPVDCTFVKDYTKTVSRDESTVVVLGGKVTTALGSESSPMTLKAGESYTYQRNIKLGDALSVSTINMTLPAPEVQFSDNSGRILHSAASKFT